ncbi:DUF4118 domain-containing protein [Polynucleobacter sp. Fuers-14]|uniref:DUF4118 domain-containing protein n=1 Tax=Polynucleobacter sp. Fuers-14 TaxID=1758364 RepID=UPI001C0C4DA7|nr:DUF4118 domain-containing protein [Polynucleobacter sp. Fuers-14]
MQIRNAKNWSIYSPLDALLYCILIFLVISSILNTLGLNFSTNHPYKFYFLAATFIAYYFGYKPASIFILISSLYANFYFVPPFGVFTLTLDELERYLINLFFGSAAIFLIEILQRERFKSKLLLLVSESRYLILLHRDNRILNQLKRKTQ